MELYHVDSELFSLSQATNGILCKNKCTGDLEALFSFLMAYLQIL